jgi:limonene-1,2-epoxide hydrolase
VAALAAADEVRRERGQVSARKVRQVQPDDVVRHYVAAVESRDASAVAECFTADAVFCNVPHEPAVGRTAIQAVFEPILARSARVRWDVHHLAVTGSLVFAERTDRFWIDGDEYSVQCTGVFVVDGDLIAELRDYVDLGVWRRRLGDVLTRAGPRPANHRSEPIG